MVQESHRNSQRIEAPQNIVVVHFGGLGDLVLFSEAFASLRAAHPRSRITFVCLEANAPLLNLYAHGPDEVVPLDFDPYPHCEVTPELAGRVTRALAGFRAGETRLYIGAGLKPPWLSWIVAAKLQPDRAVMASENRQPRLARDIMELLFLQEADFEYVAVPPGLHERERYRALLKHLGIPAVKGAALQIPESAALRADEILAAEDLSGKPYLAAFPISSPLTPEKRWPVERSAKVLQRAHDEFELPILLLGDSRESAELETFRESLSQRGVEARLFIGQRDEVPAVAAILSKARAYFGNDTGLAHLAAALGTPGVTVYGGGTWPMYAPWAPGTAGVVNPLACFGCYWDCTFGRGVCVESVPAKAVTAALSKILRGKKRADATTIALNTVPAEEQAVIADATRRYRALQADRAARLEALETSARDLSGLRRKLQDLQTAADERLAALQETKDALARANHENHRLQEIEKNIDAARSAAGERDKIIAEFETALAERDRLVKQLQDAAEELNAALREREERIAAFTHRNREQQLAAQNAQERERVIRELSAALEETDARAKALQEAADARAVKLQELVAANSSLQEVHRVAQEREAVISELRIALQETDGRATALQEAADLRAQKIDELSAELEKRNERVNAQQADAERLQELHATAQEREKIIFELNAALGEREKNAQKILEVAAEREALILELSAAVEERERRIAQLERVAEERLVALRETDEGLRAVTAEADRRAMMLAEVTSLLRERTDEA